MRGKQVEKVLRRDALPVPAVIPTGTRCVKVTIPDNDEYLVQFYSILTLLTKWNSYQQDGATKARDVAYLWKQVLKLSQCQNEVNSVLSIEDKMNIRIKPTDCTIIQMECGDGEWMDWYNPFCNGSFNPSVQPPAAGEIAVGDCLEYDVVLRGSEKWIAPVPVSDGYLIEVSGATGGWNDGTATWYCPTGFTYALGFCVSAVLPYSGDPLQTANHMRLIAEFDGTFVDAFDRQFEIPSGAGSVNLTFQANDDTLNDNSGSISFHVKICNPAPVTFVHTFDFLVSDGGWSNVGDSVWASSVGWQSRLNIVDGSGDVIITKTFDSRVITRIETSYYRTSASLGITPTPQHEMRNGLDVGAGVVLFLYDLTVGSHSQVNDISEACDRLTFDQRIDAANADGITLTRIKVYGEGSDPF